MAFKKVVVKLHHIVNTNTGDDSGNELEIYGRFDVSRLVFNADIGDVVPVITENLFSRTPEQRRSIAQGTGLIVDTTRTLDIFDGEFLQIAGFVNEHDDGFGGSDDRMGSLDMRIPFHNITGKPLDLPFSESTQRVTVKMSMAVVLQG